MQRVLQNLKQLNPFCFAVPVSGDRIIQTCGILIAPPARKGKTSEKNVCFLKNQKKLGKIRENHVFSENQINIRKKNEKICFLLRKIK